MNQLQKDIVFNINFEALKYRKFPLPQKSFSLSDLEKMLINGTATKDVSEIERKKEKEPSEKEDKPKEYRVIYEYADGDYTCKALFQLKKDELPSKKSRGQVSDSKYPYGLFVTKELSEGYRLQMQAVTKNGKVTCFDRTYASLLAKDKTMGGTTVRPGGKISTYTTAHRPFLMKLYNEQR
jgi:hypothetical protein